MSIRGKPGALYTYAKGGGRIPLKVRPSENTPIGVAIDQIAKLILPKEGPTPEQRRRHRQEQQRGAARNLQALPRPLKPPGRKET